MSFPPFKNQKNELNYDDLLTIKTGELFAKTDELQEVNEALDLLNGAIKQKIKELKESKQDLRISNNSLFIANDKLTETNEKFAAVNKELAAVNKELAAVNKELAAVNKELAAVNKQIKQHHQRQNEFINIISHELKTPIQAIIGYIELFFEKPEKKFEYGDSIMRNAIRLQNTLTDILDMSKIDNNALTLNKEQFNLNEIISTTIDEVREQITPYNNKVNIIYNNRGISDKDIVIDGDKEERIIQVISNILNNAIKFTKEGTINIDIEKNGSFDNDKDNTGNNNKSQEIIINIKDTGDGIRSKSIP